MDIGTRECALKIRGLADAPRFPVAKKHYDPKSTNWRGRGGGSGGIFFFYYRVENCSVGP